MSCKICKSSQPCGCKDTPLSIPPNYVTDPTVCPDPTPCSEIFDAQCICYSGDLLECDGQTWEIPTGTDVETVIQTLFNALCEVASSGTFNMLSPVSLNDPTTWDLGDLNGNANVIRLNLDPNGVKFTFDRVGCGDDITITVASSDSQFGPLFTATTSNSITVSSNQSDVTYEMGYSYSGVVFPVDVPITFTYESCGLTVVQNGFITLT
tara:strand:- start:360 stop:986 length:627 start_codon:yes stop_codon:yes gene_type:complete